MRTRLLVAAIAVMTSAGCDSSPSILPAESDQSTSTADPSPAPQASEQRQQGGGREVVAYIRGEPVTWSQLRPLLAERAGGRVLTDVILQRQVEHRLARRGVVVTDPMLEEEKTIMRRRLADDPDEGQRMIERLRRRQGLGERRFRQLLHRNAAMRLLVQDEVSIDESQVRQAYDVQYGPQYEIRLIVVPSASAASQVIRQAEQGEPFVNLVMEHSTDSSRQRGGLLTDVSLADPTWPDALRRTLAGMRPGDVSPPISLDNGFAIVKVESKSQGQSVQFDDVKDKLERSVRREVERVLMERLARSLLEEADVVVLDAALKRSWDDLQQTEQ